MFNIDEVNLSEEGVWTEYEGSEFLISHTSSIKFQRILARLQQPHKLKIEKGTMDPAVTKEIMCKAVSQAILLDWKNVLDGKGSIVNFSQETAFNVLMNNAAFRDFVLEFSMNLNNYRAEAIQNLGKAS